MESAGVTVGTPSPDISAAGRCLTSTVVEAYTKNLRARGRSESHLANISATLDGLQTALVDLGDQRAGTAIETWLDGLKVAPATRNRRLVEVRGLCRWAMRRDLVGKDPTRAIDTATVPDSLRPQFTITELIHILALPTPSPAMHRRFAIMALAGLRSDEAAALQWQDIDLASGVILVRARTGFRLKRGKERIVPLQNLLRSLLGEPGPASETIAPLGDSNMRREFPRFLRSCGIPIALRTAHSCRHSYAGMMTATGVPGPLLSAYLGHTSAATTMIYTQLSARYAQATDGWQRGELRLGCPSLS